MPRDYHGCKEHAGTRHMGGGACDAQPPPGLRAHPEYQQGVPGTLCKVNGFGGTPGTVGYQRRWATEAYSDWDKGEDDQVQFDYERWDAFA